ncbi:hypothetical protein [Streptomyces sp. NPDC050263]|uniref:hypothetical protein n=1 Tax=Streptomyces sp. NPDC050263 TaxID=3155037 RepID=UPI00341B9312
MNPHMFHPAARYRSRVRWLRALFVPAAALVALAALSACGGKSDSGAAVASVDGTGTGTAVPSGTEGAKTAAPDAGRPQLRLDTSQEEEARLFNVWSACIQDHGVPMQSIVKDGKQVPVNSDPAYPAASKACLPKLPLDPPELDRAKNPDYMDDFRAEIACLHEAGVKVEPMADGEGYSWPSGGVDVPNLPELQQRCLIEAFGD